MNLNHHDLLWCVRRLPKSVVALCKKNPGAVFIAGGYIRSCIANEPVNDIDVFAPSVEAANRYACDIAGPDGKIHRTDNALTIVGMRAPVQIIHRWTFATPQDCVASFDFTIASAAFWWNGTAWDSVCAEFYYADLAAKRLVYLRPARNEDAGGSILRVLKFYQRGYRIPLDSLGAVIARLMSGVRASGLTAEGEDGVARVITGLLREVDPLIDPDHIAHLPSSQES